MSRIIAAGLVVAVLLVLPGAECLAQQVDPTVQALRHGATVRVEWSPGMARSVGTITELRPAGFLFMPASGDSSQQVQFATLKALDVSTGRKGHLVHGLLIGLVSGATVGYFVASSSNSGGYKDDRVEGAVVFAVGGSVLGGFIGSHVKTDRWAPVAIR
jgi:hypothetical protein